MTLFPRQPQRMGGWLIEFSFIQEVQSMIAEMKLDGPSCMEDVEGVLVAVEEVLHRRMAEVTTNE